MSVCSAMRLCLLSWSVCPGSSQRGARFGTARHIFSTSHWRTLSPRPSLFRTKGVKKKSLLTKHDFSFGKSFLSTLGHTDLALVLFWHHQKTFFGSIISYHVTEHHPLGSNQLFLMGLGMSMQLTERKTGVSFTIPVKAPQNRESPTDI